MQKDPFLSRPWSSMENRRDAYSTLLAPGFGEPVEQASRLFSEEESGQPKMRPFSAFHPAPVVFPGSLLC